MIVPENTSQENKLFSDSCMESRAVPAGIDLEREIHHLGEAIWRRTRGEAPSLFNKSFWHGRILDWAMRDPEFKVDLFRLVDVLPMLQTREQVAQHVREYLLREGRDLPLLAQVAAWATTSRLTGGLATWVIRRNVADMAGRFIAGRNAREALPILERLHRHGMAFTADLLGEATLSEREAEAYQARYLELIDTLAEACARWPAEGIVDQNHLGPIPRANVSLKISAMDPLLDAADQEGCIRRLKRRVRPLFLHARQRGVFINVDMEQWPLHGIVLGLFEELAGDPQLKDWPHLGIAVQAYLKAAHGDVERLLALARARGTPLVVRLVKGAYWETEIVQARQNGYACPVLLEKGVTDAQYEELSVLLLENIEHLQPAFASHNLRSLAHAIVQAKALGIPDHAYEIQMLYGMAEPERKAIHALGHRVRVYTPMGELLPGMAYLVRRLLENTSNSGFLRLSHREGAGLETLLARPEHNGARHAPVPGPAAVKIRKKAAGEGEAFENCPLADFTDEAVRNAFSEALNKVAAALPLKVPVVIDGIERHGESERILKRFSPSDTGKLVAEVSLARPESEAADVEQAVSAAMMAWPAWRERTIEERAMLLELLADILEKDRFELAALEVFEEAKPWREADADVAEAVDYCRYYARQAGIELARRRLGSVPGEENWLSYEGRGPTAVIAPWNFPLAIPCGMAAAALVSGNTVLLKPAEQSCAVGHALYQRMMRAGIPAEVVQFLPGIGEEVGSELVRHPLVAQIAFTGSKKVGLKLIEEAAKTVPGQPQVKRVVCEMGGKNTIVVDDDADLDEAVAGVIRSAFVYAGQKCSAASRVAVVDTAYEPFVMRLIEACRSLPLLPATDPACRIGPVIDEEAWGRLREVIEHPGDGALTLYVGEAPEGGWYVPPALFGVAGVSHRLMQEEFFGPVLAIIKTLDFAEALRVAMASEYALTGALYSRSPEHLELAQKKFRVGNLYLNRHCTGAFVGRQPFGGFGMSGLGTKAGGPGYLINFVNPRCVTINTTRHGFTPEVMG